MKFREFTGTAGKIVQDSAVRTIIMAEFLAEAPILEYVECYQKLGGLVDKRKKNASAITSGFGVRQIDDDYTPKKGKPVFADVEMKIFGGTFQTDKAYERQGEGTQVSEHLIEAKEFARAAGRAFTTNFFIGNGANAGEISGLQTLTPASRILTFGGENGGIIPIGDDDEARTAQEQFIELLNKAIKMTRGVKSFMSMNSDVIARIETIGRHYVRTATVKDIFGNDQEVLTYKGVPMLDAGDKMGLDEMVLENDEVCGTSSDCTSIYIGTSGEGTDISVATNVGLEVETSAPNNWMQTRVEFDAGVGLFNDKAVTRIKGIRVKATA